METDELSRAARHQWRPHLEEASQLAAWGKVTAAMDVSDGLSKMLVDWPKQVGLPSTFRARRFHSQHFIVPAQVAIRPCIVGGRDYVLLFTACPREVPPITAFRSGGAWSVSVYLDGQVCQQAGFDHFSEAVHF